MIVRGEMSSQTIIDYHAPFDGGFMPYKVVLTFNSEGEILKCGHSGKLKILSRTLHLCSVLFIMRVQGLLAFKSVSG